MCEAHQDAWDESCARAVATGAHEDLRRMVGMWVRVQGGPQAAADRVRREMGTGEKVFDAIRDVLGAK